MAFRHAPRVALSLSCHRAKTLRGRWGLEPPRDFGLLVGGRPVRGLSRGSFRGQCEVRRLDVHLGHGLVSLGIGSRGVRHFGHRSRGPRVLAQDWAESSSHLIRELFRDC